MTKLRLLNLPVIVAVIGILILFAAGCADRQHSNPLDPNNPRTEGKITGLSVISVDQEVSLKWDTIDISDYVGTRILRRENPEDTYVEAAFVDGTDNFYADLDVLFDLTYHYRIQAVTDSYESPLSDEVRITPGPSRVWVGSNASAALARLTHDASHEIYSKSNFFLITGMAATVHRQGIWLSDLIQDQVTLISEDGAVLKRLQIDAPIDMDYDPGAGTLWVLKQFDKTVILVDTTGMVVAEARGFETPVSISVDRKSGACWVADVSAGDIGRLDPRDLSVLMISGLNQPEDLEAYFQDGSCWVADVSSVVRFSSGGENLVTVQGFDFAYRVGVNQNTGDCWVIDLRSGRGQSRVVKLGADGSRLLEVDGFTVPEALDVDEYDGSCIVADTGNFKVVKLSSDGSIIGEWSAAGAPDLIRISSP